MVTKREEGWSGCGRGEGEREGRREGNVRGGGVVGRSGWKRTEREVSEGDRRER